MEPAEDQVLLTGSYSSALPLLSPPATSTSPLVNSVAVWVNRLVAIEAADDQVLLTGLYNSALERAPLAAPLLVPPVTSTLPLFSNVAVPNSRPEAMKRAEDQVLLAGLYNSALDGKLGLPPLKLTPPATSTSPLFSSVAVWPNRAVPMFPADNHPDRSS